MEHTRIDPSLHTALMPCVQARSRFLVRPQLLTRL